MTECPSCEDPLEKHPKSSSLLCFKDFAGLDE